MKSRLAGICTKLGVGSRTAAVAAAIDLGIIGGPPGDAVRDAVDREQA